MSGIEVRLVAEGEHDAVDELVRAAYEHDYGPRQHGDDPFRLAVNRARLAEVWVAVDTVSGELLGSVTVSREDGERMMEDLRDDELDFRLLAVAPTARRRGVGERLTRHVVDLARRRGRRGVFMKSAPNMVPAHRLYERLGFRRDPERDGLVIGGVVQFDLYAFRIDVDDIAPADAEPTTQKGRS